MKKILIVAGIIIVGVFGYINYTHNQGVIYNPFDKDNVTISDDIIDCVLPENAVAGDSYYCRDRANAANKNGARPDFKNNELDWPGTPEETEDQIATLKTEYAAEYQMMRSGEMDSWRALIFITRLFAAQRCVDQSQNDYQVVTCINHYIAGPASSLYGRVLTE